MTVIAWEKVAAKKRSDLLATFPAELVVPPELLPPDSQDDLTSWPETSGWFTKEELEITSASAAELLAKLARGDVSSETVTRAFCKRAIAAHQLVRR